MISTITENDDLEVSLSVAAKASEAIYYNDLEFASDDPL